MIKDLFGSNNHRSSHTIVSGTGTSTTADPAASAASVASVAKPVAVATTDLIPSTSSKSADEAVLGTVHEWAKAWSSQNSKKYLEFYATDFKTPDGEGRAAWEKQRQDRIATPKSIKVTISDAKVKLTDDAHATINFRQHYQASHLHTTSNKTLVLVKSNDKWLIAEERTGK
jgi:murein L,D-transpeptidase YafK